MCTEVFVNEKLCGNIGDLRSALGGPIVYDGGDEDPRMCLCGLDSKATARRYGMTVVIDYEQYGFGVEAFVSATGSRPSE